jgi:4-amino-4-deoxy-L-arabinose transferase-like glycosyltransferase
MQDRTQRFLILFLIPLFLYVVPLPFAPLMEPDEGRYSAIPSAMNATGDYITPRLKGAVYFEKPPLAYWATAIAFQVFGENEFSSRLFAALCAWGCIILTFRMGNFFYGFRTGLFAAAVLTTSLYHASIGRINILDMPLAFFVCMAIWSGFCYYAAPDKRRINMYLLYIFSALAFLAKGLIGILFPFGIILIWLIISRRWRETLSLFSPFGILFFSAIALPWLILVQKENPDFLRFFFIQEHLLRYATKMHDRYQPVYFYLPVIIAGTLPWCAFLPEAFSGIHKKTETIFSDVEKRFFLVWIGVILVFFSISSSKLIPYIAPIFPPIAVFLGRLFRKYEDKLEAIEGERGQKSVQFRYRVPVIFQSLLFMGALLAPLFFLDPRVEWVNWWPWILLPLIIQALIIFLPDLILNKTGKGWFLTVYLLFSLFLFFITFPVAQYITPYKSAWPLTQAIKTHLPAETLLYQYGMSLYGVDFYTGMRTPIVDDIGEVGYGSERLPRGEKERYFLLSASFFKLLQGNKGVYCATNSSEKLMKLKKVVPAITILWHNDELFLLKIN